MRAQEDHAATMTDEKLLQRSSQLGRIMFTQDVRFKALAELWQMSGQPFGGLLFGNQLGVTVGTYVRDLDLIAKATDPSEWLNSIQHLPFR
jgi:hypothetical protein